MAVRRRSSFQKCPQNRSEQRRRCFKNSVMVLLILVTLHYIITNYFWYWEGLEAATKAIIDRGDEYLTTRLFSNEWNDFQRVPAVGVTLENNISNMIVTTISTFRNSTELPGCVKEKRFGTYSVNTSSVDVFKLEVAYPMVNTGGYYLPPNCSAKSKIAIIVPYRGLQTNLGIFLNHIHPFMIAQQVEYQIFIIQQSGNRRFNKGRLYNAGFLEVRKLNTFSCIVFHELNLVPSNLEITYSCSTQPHVISSRIDDRESKGYRVNETISLFGGVVSMTVDIILNVNGYSNNFFCQDKNMMWRLLAAGYRIVRLEKSIGVFEVLPHERNSGIIYRFCHSRAVKRYKVDGLSTLKYFVKSKKLHRLYTHIIVDIHANNGKFGDLDAIQKLLGN